MLGLSVDIPMSAVHEYMATRGFNWTGDSYAVNRADNSVASNASDAFGGCGGGGGGGGGSGSADFHTGFNSIAQKYRCIWINGEIVAKDGYDKSIAKKVYSIKYGDEVDVVGVCTFKGCERARLADGNWTTIKDEFGRVFFAVS